MMTLDRTLAAGSRPLPNGDAGIIVGILSYHTNGVSHFHELKLFSIPELRIMFRVVDRMTGSIRKVAQGQDQRSGKPIFIERSLDASYEDCRQYARRWVIENMSAEISCLQTTGEPPIQGLQVTEDAAHLSVIL